MLSIKPFFFVVTFLLGVAVVNAEQTVLDILQSLPEMSTFVRYISAPENSRLYNMLSNQDANLTVFAPMNDAFDRLNQIVLTKANVTFTDNTMKKAMYYHVVPDLMILSNDLTDGFQQIPTLYNQFITGSRVMRARMRYQAPQNVADGLIVFGRGRDSDILRGWGTPAHFLRPDIMASNGVIHIINRVLIPPLSLMKTLEMRGLTKVIESIMSANAVDTFQSLSQVTFLVPTNEAVTQFTATHSDITPASLRNVLLTHVIPGLHFSYDLREPASLNIPTKSGELLRISTKAGMTLSIGNAMIKKANILTKSGVLHEIDRVLVPGELQ